MLKQIKIKRFDPSLPLPEYKTAGAAGFDLAARETVTLKPGVTALIPLNVAIAVPKGYFVLLAARSSLHKLGLLPVNGVGIIDTDYAGDEDEYKFLAHNFTRKTVTVEKGTRVAQGILLKFSRATWRETSKMKAKTRGGFGSTGHR
ncbi:MAG TPA: dUTP diphosphatase [Candidatus Paceibacterota bacterium]|nr:dUTP diphosphatase [Candidatus Paceibacterota bacterium]